MARQGDPRLAGPPERTSEQFDPVRAAPHTGLLKLRLGHSANGTVLVPEQLFLEYHGSWCFHQVSFFGAPILGFNIGPGLHVATFNLDIGPPRAAQHTRVIAEIRSDGLIRRYDDGAQLYRCTIEGPASLANNPSGLARVLPDGDFALEVFHITSAAAAKAINSSGELWSSAWNLQGTCKLTNVAYAYLTSLPQICSEKDLRCIAMASDGVIRFQTTSTRPREEVLELKVYRESTTGRTDSIPVAVAAALIAPPHLLLHRPVGDTAYYEVIGPEIYRIGLLPGASLRYIGGIAFASPDLLKRFSYIVVGDAAELAGLAAPYDEEETRQIMHLETLDKLDFFEFWQAHANTDQMGRPFEPRELR